MRLEGLKALPAKMELWKVRQATHVDTALVTSQAEAHEQAMTGVIRYVVIHKKKVHLFLVIFFFFLSRIGIVLMYTLDKMFVAVIKTKKIVLIQISHPNGHVYSNLS